MCGGIIVNGNTIAAFSDNLALFGYNSSKGSPPFFTLSTDRAIALRISSSFVIVN